jgi:hypothetical protein
MGARLTNKCGIATFPALEKALLAFIPTIPLTSSPILAAFVFNAIRKAVNPLTS